MREKIKRSKKGLMIIGIFMIVVLGCSIIGIKTFSSKNIPSDTSEYQEKQNKIDDMEKEEPISNIDEEKVDSKDINTTPTTPTNTTDTSSNTKKSTSNKTNKTESNNTKTNSKEPSKSTINSNTSSNNSSESNVPEQTPKEDTKPTEEQVDLTKIVDTTNYLYSTHKGVVEFSSNAKCTLAGNDITDIELDKTIAYNKEHIDNQIQPDINYFRCVEVMSKGNTIMGYYLKIFCESGNCNNYKSTIDMNKYQ